MQHSTRTEHRWDLEEGERFEWEKTTYAYAGHHFEVHRVELLFRDGETAVALHGPWTDLPENEIAPDTAAVNGGWQFLYVNLAEDAARVRELPLEVRDVLAIEGLRIPLEVG